jgi:hypothetical protein
MEEPWMHRQHSEISKEAALVAARGDAPVTAGADPAERITRSDGADPAEAEHLFKIEKFSSI